MPPNASPTAPIRQSLQENLLTLLCHDDKHGKHLISLATPEMFDGVHAIIAERAWQYWRAHGKAPGIVHTADLIDDILADPDDRRGDTLRRVLRNMTVAAGSLNADYVIAQISQQLRSAEVSRGLLAAVEAHHAGEPVEDILGGLLRTRAQLFDPGIIGINHPDRIRAYVRARRNEFPTGIPALDRAGAGPARKRLLLLIGGKGRGKSWGLIHFSKRALLAGFRVCHATIENDADETLVRYNQSLFALPIYRLDQPLTSLRIDTSNATVSYRNVTPDFSLADAVPVEETEEGPGGNVVALPSAQARLQARWDEYGTRLADNLVIKQFAANSLTPNMLRGYLDTLEQTHNFIPDMIVIDTPKNMKIDPKDRRGSIGLNMEEVRAIGGDRNAAVVAAHQLNREGYDLARARSTHVGEDWSVVHTADIVLVHSATDQELRAGTARLFVEHVRGGRDKFEVLITHNYETGQFAIFSKQMPWSYDAPEYVAVRSAAERMVQGNGQQQFHDPRQQHPQQRAAERPAARQPQPR